MNLALSIISGVLCVWVWELEVTVKAVISTIYLPTIYILAPLPQFSAYSIVQIPSPELTIIPLPLGSGQVEVA